MAHYFEIKQNKAGDYVVRFKYNSETIWSSEGYTSKASAINAIESAKKNASGALVRADIDDPLAALAMVDAPDKNLIIDVNTISEEYKSVEKAFRELSDKLRETNDLRGFSSDELDVVRQEVGEIGAEVKKEKFRAAHVWNILKSTLTWIAEKSGDAVVKALALALLVAAARLLGINIPHP